MKARMLENEKEMMEMKKTYEEKLKQSKMEHVVRGGGRQTTWEYTRMERDSCIKLGCR